MNSTLGDVDPAGTGLRVSTCGIGLGCDGYSVGESTISVIVLSCESVSSLNALATVGIAITADKPRLAHTNALSVCWLSLRRNWYAP